MNAFSRLAKVPPSSFQTSRGKHLSSGVSWYCVSHNASNTGSSKLLQQHANATAVALASDTTSSHARSLRISSTSRQGWCILDPGDAPGQWGSMRYGYRVCSPVRTVRRGRAPRRETQSARRSSRLSCPSDCTTATRWPHQMHSCLPLNRTVFTFRFVKCGGKSQTTKNTRPLFANGDVKC